GRVTRGREGGSGGTPGGVPPPWERVPDRAGSPGPWEPGRWADRPGTGAPRRMRGTAAPRGADQPSDASAESFADSFFSSPFSPPLSAPVPVPAAAPAAAISGSAVGSTADDSSPSGSRPGVAKSNFSIMNLKMK